MRLLIIDGNSILNRAYYGIRALSNSKGVFTNALTGFMNIYLKELDTLKPDSVCVAFDMKAKTFRHEKFDFYKANRKGMPEDLAQQLPIIKDILRLLGVPVLTLEGYEADDILGSVSRLFDENGDMTYILSGDRDILQLIKENVTVRLVTTKETLSYDEAVFFEKYQTQPIHLIDIKALMGDSSDNIPGVPGIGEKTALSLIAQYESIENIYDSFDAIKLPPSQRKHMEEGKQSAFDSKWLATINTNAPISHNREDYSFNERKDKELCDLLTELEMFKLIERLKLDASAPAKAQTATIAYTIGNNSELVNLASSSFIYDGKLQVYSSGKVYETENLDEILGYLTSEGEKTAYDAKEAHKLCFKNNRELKNVSFICDLAGYLLNSQSSEYSLKNLCAAYSVPYSDDEKYGDILSLDPLSEKLRNEIDALDMGKLLYDIEQPLCEVLASMEVLGVKVDKQGICDFGDSLSGDIRDLEQAIHMLAGHEFNISSPKQLGVVLFEELGLPSGKKTKSGYSTNAEVLEGLVNKHPIVQLILDYRTLTKLASTYVDGLLAEVEEDGRVRSDFKQTETRTGRISSANPNMQNIPVRKELGRNMRRFFVADEGKILLDADYSQIELRVLAAMCDDKNMQDAFLSGEDIHTRTAAQVFGVHELFVDPEMRRAAKAVNFGIVYGIGAFSLSKDINVSVAQADRYIKDYLAAYPNVGKFMEDTVAFGLANGYVTTLFGRRRYIPELKMANKNVQAAGKRMAMNAPIQGTAADIIKIAMVKVYNRLKAENINAKLILQVHDELILESSVDCADKAAEILSQEMNNAVSLAVPITAEVNSGKSWYDAKD